MTPPRSSSRLWINAALMSAIPLLTAAWMASQFPTTFHLVLAAAYGGIAAGWGLLVAIGLLCAAGMFLMDRYFPCAGGQCRVVPVASGRQAVMLMVATTMFVLACLAPPAVFLLR